MKLLRNKKGDAYFEYWPEIIFFILLVIGFVLSVSLGYSLPSAIIAYITSLLSGTMAGRLIFERKHKMKFPYFLMIIGFLIGYLMGTKYGEKSVILILFFIGGILGFYLRDKEFFKDIRY